MTAMTLEEQERRAYADGDIHRAALLAYVLDQAEETACARCSSCYNETPTTGAFDDQDD